MFQGIHHVAFVVRDMQQSMDRVENSFGIEHESRNQLGGGVVDVAVYRLGDNIFELIQPLVEEGWAYDHLQENGEGFFHIAFEVDDIEKRMRELKERGIHLETDEPQEGYDWLVTTMNAEDTIVPMQIVETYD